MIYNINNDEHSKECLICLEIHNSKNNKFIRIEKLKGYEKKCSCTALTHEKCLYDWYQFKTVCPICRFRVHKKLTLTEKIKKKCNSIYGERHNILSYVYCITYNTLCVLFLTTVIFLCAELYIRISEEISLTTDSKSKNQTNYIEPFCYYDEF